MTNLIIIAGTSFCGKTILAQKISKYFKIKLLSQNNTPNVNDIVSFVNNTNLKNIIVEHNNILSVASQFKNVNIFMFALNVKKSLLNQHFKNKVSCNLANKNDKNLIDNQNFIVETSKQFNATILNINENADYNTAFNEMIYFIKTNLHLKKYEKSKFQQQLDNSKINETKQFKSKYFTYYDDVKSRTHKVYDW